MSDIGNNDKNVKTTGRGRQRGLLKGRLFRLGVLLAMAENGTELAPNFVTERSMNNNGVENNHFSTKMNECPPKTESERIKLFQREQ